MMKSDEKLKKDVVAELEWEPSVNATLIGVEVQEGVVTLAGHLSSYAEKLSAEKAVQRVAGVKALVVEIEIKIAGSSLRSDVDLASSAKNVLLWTTYFPKQHIDVMVEKGWVTLSGEVEWEYQRQAALDAVRPLIGVSGVVDNISIKKTVSSTAVKVQIEAALRRGAKSESREVFVDVSGGDVTLSGQVHSWYERDLARNSAWGTAGVHKVIDNITVVY